MNKHLEISRRGFIGSAASIAAVPLLGAKSFASSEAPSVAATMGIPAPGALPRFLHASVATADGRVLVCGGYQASEVERSRYGGAPSASVQIFEPLTGQWFNCAPMNTPRARHSAALMSDGRVVVAGGFFHFALDSVEIYDPILNRWTNGDPLPQPLYDHTAVIVRERMILIGGPSGTLVSATEVRPLSR